MKIFAEAELRQFLSGRLQQMSREVHGEEKNRLLNMNEIEYINYLTQKYSIEPIEFDWESVFVSDREEMIRAEHFPGTFNVYTGKSYPKQVITYHVPFKGLAELVKFSPSTRLLWSAEVTLRKNVVSFDIINWRDNADEIRREAEAQISNIRTQAGHSQNEVVAYNNGLEAQATQIVQARKEQLLKQSNLMASLGVPFKRADQVPATFAIPTAKKAPIIKPTAPTSAFAPEPALDQSVYRDILRLCHDTGVEMERHPAIYQGKDEETLRDHFLMVLAPHFQSVTGETFNRTGKTDILIRHERANVFVAECKYWGGIQMFYKTIDQALGYLTWRDSKAAILCFVQNRELQPVLQQIETDTSSHSCFVKYSGKTRESWFNFEFHLKDDHSRGVQLAVLAFHFPPAK
ncbi:MAG: hypothetical protein OHK0022_07370 [Roseiflexaceae bacterium]